MSFPKTKEQRKWQKLNKIKVEFKIKLTFLYEKIKCLRLDSDSNHDYSGYKLGLGGFF